MRTLQAELANVGHRVIRDSLGRMLLEGIQHIQKYNASLKKVASLGVSTGTSTIHLPNAIEELISEYFRKLSLHAEQQHCEKVPVTIAVPTEAIEFKRHKRSHDGSLSSDLYSACLDNIDESEAPELVEQILLEIDFISIHDDLQKQIATAEQRGYQHIADYVVDQFHFNNTRYYKVKIRKRSVVAIQSAQTYFQAHGEIAKLKKLANSLDIISNMTGCQFGTAITSYTADLDQLSYSRQSIESRTSYGKNTPLEIVCYNTTTEFRFSHKAFDAISAFVYLHGSECAQEAISGILTTLVEAA